MTGCSTVAHLRQDNNLSSAIRPLVFEFYRSQIPDRADWMQKHPACCQQLTAGQGCDGGLIRFYKDARAKSGVSSEGFADNVFFRLFRACSIGVMFSVETCSESVRSSRLGRYVAAPPDVTSRN
jgi:hypothetical protein